MKNFFDVAVAVIIAISCFMFGRHVYPKCPPIETVTETVVRVDTLRDTVRIPVTRYITRTRTDTLKIAGDTVFVAVEVPVERKIYQTADYRAEIEGFKPSLVSMDIYRKTEQITQIRTVTVPDTRRWGVGLQVGYGLSVQNGNVKATPYLGVGVSYNIWEW